jgi:hypothetical protein
MRSLEPSGLTRGFVGDSRIPTRVGRILRSLSAGRTDGDRVFARIGQFGNRHIQSNSLIARGVFAGPKLGQVSTGKEPFNGVTLPSFTSRFRSTAQFDLTLG